MPGAKAASGAARRFPGGPQAAARPATATVWPCTSCWNLNQEEAWGKKSFARGPVLLSLVLTEDPLFSTSVGLRLWEALFTQQIRLTK